MRIVNAKCGSVIPIGRLGENEAVQVIFDVASWKQTYGNGTFNLLNKRNGDANAYPCDVIEDDGKLLWNINSADVANVGYGQCEIVYIVGDTIAKSEIYTTIVGKALTGGGDVPEPWEDWVERVLQAGADVDEAVNLWQNMTAVGVEADEAFADYNNGVLTIGIPAGGGGGTSDHRQLSNRDAANQHPINAINGLQSALDGKQPIGDYATTQDVSDLADIVDTKADASDIPSLDGYATETYVNNHHDSTKQDKLTAGDNITIVGNVISAAGGGGGGEWELWDEITTEDGTLVLDLSSNGIKSLDELNATGMFVFSQSDSNTGGAATVEINGEITVPLPDFGRAGNGSLKLSLEKLGSGFHIRYFGRDTEIGFSSVATSSGSVSPTNMQKNYSFIFTPINNFNNFTSIKSVVITSNVPIRAGVHFLVYVKS